MATHKLAALLAFLLVLVLASAPFPAAAVVLGAAAAAATDAPADITTNDAVIATAQPLPPLPLSRARSSVVCLGGHTWSYNSRHESPCTVAAYVGAACNNGEFTVKYLVPGTYYTVASLEGTTTIPTQNACLCSTAMYMLLSACAECQDGIWSNWTEWASPCTTTFTRTIPADVPPNAWIPIWAFMSVNEGDMFDIFTAQEIARLSVPDVNLALTTPRAPPPTTLTPTSTPTSTIMATTTATIMVSATASAAGSQSSSISVRAVVGLGLVGSIVLVIGVCLFAILVAAMIYRHKRTRDYNKKPAVVAARALLPRTTSIARRPVPPDRKLNGTPPQSPPPFSAARSWSGMRYTDAAHTPSPPSAVLSLESQQPQRAATAGTIRTTSRYLPDLFEKGAEPNSPMSPRARVQYSGVPEI